jgi:hypothetical protein
MIDSRIEYDGDLGASSLPHQGVAEIWLANGEEQLASLQTDEFLQGARLDEPNWAAFWLTIVLDTTAHEIVAGPPLTSDPTWVKLMVLLKRKPGMSLEEYRRQSLETYAPIAAKIPGLRRYLNCHTVDGFYVFGEASFDSVEQYWFDDVDALRAALDSSYVQEVVKPALESIVDPKYIFSLTAKEDWIIGPQPR